MTQTLHSRASEGRTIALKRSLACGAAVGALLLGGAAFAQDEGGIETVYVTGYRASLEKSIDIKRSTAEMVDAITAEDIGKFPDSNLAESLQRLPGVAVDRDNGEGRSITVRGLSKDFTRVTLNGLQALSTAGNNDAGTQPNRDRGFDFNTFATELFSQLKVQKSASAATEDGSLGATVGLSTPHPFDYGEKVILQAQNAWYEMGKPFNPRVSALVSETFGENFGVLLSAAYTLRSQFIDKYQRSPGQSDFAYRGSNFTFANPLVGFNGATQTSPYLIRNGFAAPTGTSCNGTISPYYTGVIPGNNITNAAYCAALSGSTASAYAAVNTPQGWGIYDTVTTTRTTSAYASPGALTLIPALPSLTHQQLYQQRIGLTGGMQWQVDDDTLLTFDALFSTAYQNSTNYQIAPIGLNRNNTNATLNTASTSTLTTVINNTLGGMFTNCTEQVGSATQADIVCGGGVNGTAAGITRNQTAIAYYTNPAYGYAANGADAIAAAISFVGRPATKLIDATVVSGSPYGAASRLVLDNVDFRSGADQSVYTTEFTQMSLNGTHNFSDRFKIDATLGWSHSRNHQIGLLAEVNRMDNRYANTGQYFIWDDTGTGEMPAMQFGFDVANPSNWTFVKNFSALRHYQYFTDNKYRTFMGNASYELSDELTLLVGVNMRIFDFSTAYFQRAMKDVVNPSFQEAGVSTSQMTQLTSWGKGLSVPAGTPTQFIVPNLEAYKNVFGFACNCINEYGDWRLTNMFNPASTGTAGNTFNVSEHSKAYYAQLDFHDVDILGGALMGNVGLRFVTTELKSIGHALQGDELTANSSYNDFLPSINLAYSLTDDMMIRAAAAKVIARPSLGFLAPSITAMSVPTGAGATSGMTIAMGNPYLKPYRAKTVDIGWEWYFDKGAMLAVTGFVKWIADNPQTVVSSGAVTDFLTPAQIAVIQGQFSRVCAAAVAGDTTCSQGANVGSNTANQYNYLLGAGNSVAVTQALNGMGGVLEGIEITYQQHLDFIPAVFEGEGFGVNANYTKIRSVQHYIINSTATSTVTADGPWNGASPDAWNLTIYYDGPNWEARVSSAFRSGYLYLFPVAGGSDVLGMGNAPLVNDFGYSKNTFNVDFSGSYDVSENMEITLEALNLTNQPDRRWAYQGTPQTTQYASTGRTVFAGFRLKY